MMKFLRVIKKTFVWLVGLAALFAGLSAALAYFYEDEVKTYVISKIEEKFSASIQVEKINLSFWKKFPNAGLQFENITVKDVHIAENPPVLAARELSLQFDIWDIIHKKYILKKVEISGGKIDMLIYKSGKNNFNLMAEDKNDTSDFFLSMPDFRLNNIEFAFENQGSMQSYNIKIENMKVPFMLRAGGFRTGLTGNFRLLSYRSEGVELFKNKNVVLTAGLSYDNSTGKLSFEPSEFMVDGITFKLKGYFDTGGKKIFTALNITTPQLNLAGLIKTLPEEFSSKLDSYGPDGDIKIEMAVEGQLGGEVMPSVKASFSLHKGSLLNKDIGLKISDVSLEGQFSNGQNHNLVSSFVKIKNFSCLVNNERFSGNLSVSNFKDAKVRASLNSFLDLQSIKKIAGLTFVEKTGGQMRGELVFSARVKNLFEAPALLSYSIKGNLLLKDAELKLKGQKVHYQNINGKISFNNNLLRFSSFKLETMGAHFSVKAAINNYISLFAKDNKKPAATLGADIIVDNLSYVELMEIIDVSNEEESGGAVPGDININFAAGKFQWDKLTAKDLRGNFVYSNDRWSLENVSFKSHKGSVKGNLRYVPAGDGAKYLSSGTYTSLDISELFRTFDNFGQQTVTSENISGEASGKFSLNMLFDKDGNLDKKQLNGLIDIEIIKGRLSGIKELDVLSDYTRIPDFSEINFSKLTNSITIADEKILIPKMHVVSDKMDADVFGYHTFDNSYDYHLSILLSDILGAKIKQNKENEFGIIEDDETGKTRVFLNIRGQGSDFEVNYDKKEAAGKLKKNLKEEGESLKDIVKQEFKNEKRDSLRRAKRQAKEKEKQQLKRQEEGQFIIEWDDDTTGVPKP